MKKFWALSALALTMFWGCGDNSSAADTINSSASQTEPIDSDGYLVSYSLIIDESNHLLIQFKNKACVYRSGDFLWEDIGVLSDTSKFKLVGDSLWIGPSDSKYNPDDFYRNYERLSIGSSHDGLYGQWTSTGCTRIIGQNEIKCDIAINGMYGYSQSQTYTKDSVYFLTKYDSSRYPEDYGSIRQAIRYMGYYISQDAIDSLENIGLIKQKTKETFTVNGQDITFKYDGKSDSTGINYLTIFESNGKNCTRVENLVEVTEKECRDASQKKIPHEYESGEIVTSFSYNNKDEFKQCLQEMLTEPARKTLEENDF